MNTTLIPFVLCIGSQIGIDWLLLSRLFDGIENSPQWTCGVHGELWLDARDVLIMRVSLPVI
jgi:hypothetical protein